MAYRLEISLLVDLPGFLVSGIAAHNLFNLLAIYHADPKLAYSVLIKVLFNILGITNKKCIKNNLNKMRIKNE
jgi:proline dehydrogenase